MSLYEFITPLFKVCGILFLIFLAYMWGNWNGYVEGLRRGNNIK